jgi:hypothetical protein
MDMIYRRRSFIYQKNIIFVVIGFTIVGLLILFVTSVFSSQNQPESVVREFYEYEQQGDFGSAWELFHSSMKKRFTKNGYVTERSHIYMSHYGVTTFDFTVSDAEKIKNWKMTKDGPIFKEVYKVQIQQTFLSKFGTFTIQQDVYVVKEKDEWKVAWAFGPS